MIALSSRVVASQDQVSAEVGGEAVILGMHDATYYGLNEVAARIWSLIQEPRPVREVCDAILAEYEVDESTCERTTLTLLNDLLARGLLTVVGGPPP